MGFSLASSSSLSPSYENRSSSHNGFWKLLPVDGNQKTRVSFKIPRYICCKPESIDFEERTSPAEVYLFNPILLW